MCYINCHTHFYDNTAAYQIINLTNDFTVPDIDTFFSAGIHPWNIREQAIDDLLTGLDILAAQGSIVAIGECGLDRACDIPLSTQKSVFTSQLDIATAHQLPVIIHNVKADSDLLQIRKARGIETPWILHGYHGSPENARKLTTMGCMLSFGDDRNSKVRRVLSSVHTNTLLLETDDRFMSIATIYASAAEILNLELTVLKKIIFQNFATLFNIEKDVS
ncbi:MAG: TatD family hydrolase [Bacteroidales bacterium]|nr:TatD family hydrolase [Bacteroidales bacterium]